MVDGSRRRLRSLALGTGTYGAEVNLGNTTLAINIDASKFGSVAIVALGDGKLEIAGNSAKGVVAATKGNVAFGGVILIGVNDSLVIDNVLRTADSVQLVTSQFATVVEYDIAPGNFSLGTEEYCPGG